MNTEQLRAEFEEKYRVGGGVVEYDEYEQAVQWLCFNWYCHGHQAAAKSRDELIGKLVGALGFYADEINHARVHRCVDSQGSYAGSEMSFDKGKVAKQAIAEAKAQGYGE